jgi:hypothetical protein
MALFEKFLASGVKSASRGKVTIRLLFLEPGRAGSSSCTKEPRLSVVSWGVASSFFTRWKACLVDVDRLEVDG